MRSIPEKTLEHWTSIYLSSRFPNGAMWWPTSGEDVLVELPWLAASGAGKTIALELKTTEAAGSNHVLWIDSRQLDRYLNPPFGPPLPVYYVFPIPHWSGHLTSRPGIAPAALGTTTTAPGVVATKGRTAMVRRLAVRDVSEVPQYGAAFQLEDHAAGEGQTLYPQRLPTRRQRSGLEQPVRPAADCRTDGLDLVLESRGEVRAVRRDPVAHDGWRTRLARPFTCARWARGECVDIRSIAGRAGAGPRTASH